MKHTPFIYLIKGELPYKPISISLCAQLFSIVTTVMCVIKQITSLLCDKLAQNIRLVGRLSTRAVAVSSRQSVVGSSTPYQSASATNQHRQSYGHRMFKRTGSARHENSAKGQGAIKRNSLLILYMHAPTNSSTT